MQKLALVSVVTLVLLAGAGSVVVAVHPFDQTSQKKFVIENLPSTNSNAVGGGSPSGMASSATISKNSTTFTTGTNSNSTSSPSANDGGTSGSLLLGSPPPSGGHENEEDDSNSGDHSWEGNATSVHTQYDD